MAKLHQTQSRISVSKCRKMPILSFVLTLLCVSLIGCYSCSSDSVEVSQNSARLDALESTIKHLQISTAAMRIAFDSIRTPETELKVGRDFSIHCAGPWDELSSMGRALWGCRTKEPLENGFYPNCNLTSSIVKTDINVQQYFDTSMSESVILSNARLISRRDTTLNGQRAVEAEFEHSFTGQPLRMLSTVILGAGRAYTVTCSSPPTAYEAILPTFRRIIGSFRVIWDSPEYISRLNK